MGADETGTHQRLMACRGAIDELVVRHEGRIVGTAGDSVLADFPSVIEALKAAVDIQETLRGRNEGLPTEERLEFRIGINLGDVIVDGRDIFGDGVNVAATVQGSPEPGGVAISGAVYDQISNKLNLESAPNAAATRVKNTPAPVRVYTVEGQGARALRRSCAEGRAPPPDLARRLSVLAAVGGSGRRVSGWPRRGGSTMSRAATGRRDPTKLAAPPAIAVLPFETRAAIPKNATSPMASPRTSSSPRSAASPISW